MNQRPNINQLQDGRVLHKDCEVQELGVDYSSGYGYKGYFCPNHSMAFKVELPVTKLDTCRHSDIIFMLEGIKQSVDLSNKRVNKLLERSNDT